MANLAGIVTSRPEIRRAFIESVGPVIAPFEGLLTGSESSDDFALTWAAPATFPVKCASKGAGDLSLEFGYPEENYFAELSIRNDTVSLGSDSLGLFPFYYVETPESIAFATSPHLLMKAPGLRKKMDESSLAMLLLFGAIIEGRTLLENLRRLPPGRKLDWKRGSGGRLRDVGTIRPNDSHFGNTLEGNFSIVDGLLEKSVRRAIRDGAGSMLLSGGLDSRLLAGYAHETGLPILAITQGRGSDFETKCAGRVSRELGWEHEIVEDDPDVLERTAVLKLDHEFLAGGFHVTPFPQMVTQLQKGGAIFSGAYGDGLLGCRELGPNEMKNYGFERHAGAYYKIFFTPDEARRLLRPPHGEAVDDMIERLRVFYEGSGTDFQRAWRFDAELDCMKLMFPRYLAFGARVVLPYVDPDLVREVSGMPPEHLQLRNMQRLILFRRFPHLAGLPMDRNSYSNPPALGPRRALVQPGLSLSKRIEIEVGHLSNALLAPVRTFADRAIGRERRFYYRTLGISLPGWRSMREKAIRYADKLGDFFDPSEFRRVLDSREDFERAQRLKILIGFALWHERSFA